MSNTVTTAIIAGAFGAGGASLINSVWSYLDRRDRLRGLFRDERLEAVTELLTATDAFEATSFEVEEGLSFGVMDPNGAERAMAAGVSACRRAHVRLGLVCQPLAEHSLALVQGVDGVYRAVMVEGPAIPAHEHLHSATTMLRDQAAIVLATGRPARRL